MNVEVTSASKKAERLQDVASSLYVVTQEDIKRSGATRVQDVLNMVPGMFFQYLNYQNTAAGMRESASSFLGSVLVLVDNVPLQSPFYFTFQWEHFDFDLNEIDRIEIIKGPGGTIYGANAATGIINIFTKNPEDSQGIRASVQSGTNGLLMPSVRYGTNLGDNGSITVYGKGHFFNGYTPLSELKGQNVTVPKSDGSGDTTITNSLYEDVYQTNKLTFGMRANSAIDDRTKLSSQFYMTNHKSNRYSYRQTTSTNDFVETSNTNSFGSLRLDHNVNEDHSLFLQYTSTIMNTVSSSTDNSVSINNLEFQDNITKSKNQISYGANGRVVLFNADNGDPSATDIAFFDPNAREFLYGVFVQDKITLGDKFDVTAGIKAETWTLIDNKPEWSPSARFAYRPKENFTLWGAASRSVTTPGFIQTNIELTISEADPMTGLSRSALTNGDATDQTEYLTAEIGAKGGKGKFTYDVSAFYAQVNGSIGLTSPDFTNFPALFTPASLGGYLVNSSINPDEMIIPFYYTNNTNATNIGGEAVFKYRHSENLTLEASYAYFSTESETDGVTNEVDVPETPEHIARLRAYINLPRNYYLTLNNMVTSVFGANEYFYDTQSSATLGSGDVGYVLHPVKTKYRLDFKISKRFTDQVSAFIWGMDITNPGTIQSYNCFATSIPYQTHGLVGLGTDIAF